MLRYLKRSDIFIKYLKLNMMSYLTDFVDRIYLFSSADTPKAYNNAIRMKNASQLFNELFISPRNVLKKSTVTHLQFSNIWFLEKCTMLNDIVESHIYYS